MSPSMVNEPDIFMVAVPTAVSIALSVGVPEMPTATLDDVIFRVLAVLTTIGCVMAVVSSMVKLWATMPE